MERTYPNVGDQCYMRQFTGNEWVDMVKRPYTVIAVEKNKVIVQEANLIFNGPRYYDTVADIIEPDIEGQIKELTWHNKRKLWGTKGDDKDYPVYLIVGQGYRHQPYLD